MNSDDLVSVVEIRNLVVDADKKELIDEALIAHVAQYNNTYPTIEDAKADGVTPKRVKLKISFYIEDLD